MYALKVIINVTNILMTLLHKLRMTLYLLKSSHIIVLYIYMLCISVFSEYFSIINLIKEEHFIYYILLI